MFILYRNASSTTVSSVVAAAGILRLDTSVSSLMYILIKLVLNTYLFRSNDKVSLLIVDFIDLSAMLKAPKTFQSYSCVLLTAEFL